MDEREKKFFSYKDKPLVRKGNTLYYGSMLDEYVVMLKILSQKEVAGEKVADKISVQLMRTATDIKPQDIVVKHSEKNGLGAAMDIADIWLNRALSE